MEWWHFLLAAIVGVGILMYFNRRAKAKEPYRTDYKPLMPKGLTEDDSEMESLLNKHRGSFVNKNFVYHTLEYLRPDQLLFNLAKEHCLYMSKAGKASHDNSKKRAFAMRTNNALATGECTADDFRNVKSFLHGYINHKYKTGKKKGKYSHRHIIEGDFTHYGHCIIYGEQNYDVLLVAKFKNG
jgi:uncharacterized protein YkwD